MKIVLGSYDEKPHPFHYKWIDDTWIISDIEPRFPNMVKIDARNIPYKNLEALYASHLLEHIKYDEVSDVLKHWYEALGEGGYIIINVPDMEWFLDNWVRLTVGEESLSDYFYDKNKMLQILNGPSSEEHDKHKSWFIESKLKHLMEEAGFKVTIDRVYEAHDMGCLIAKGVK